MEMGDQHGEGIADSAKLLAVGGDVGEHVSLDRARQGKLEYGHARLPAPSPRRRGRVAAAAGREERGIVARMERSEIRGGTAG